MSVALYRKPELQNIAESLHHHLMESNFQTWGRYEKADAYRAIAVTGIANQTAYFLTYGGAGEWGDMRNLDDSTQDTFDAKETCENVNRLIYNTISNEGTHCLPSKYEEILKGMIECITNHATGWY